MNQPLPPSIAGAFPRWVLVLAAAVLAAGSLWQQGWRDSHPSDAPEQRPEGASTSTAAESESSVRPPAQVSPHVPRRTPPGASVPSRPKSAPEAAPPTIVRNVRVRDLNGRVAWQGDVDLQPTLERIARGEKFPHRNDGGTFLNLERRLPSQPNGYYKEYVHPTPGLRGPGPQRVVLGRDGGVYYTHDHYQTFQRIR